MSNFDRSFSARLDLDCGSFPYGDPAQPKIAYGIPPGYKATNMDPTHRYVLDSNGNLAVNPNCQRAIDKSKLDKVGVALDLVKIATSAAVVVTAFTAAQMVVTAGAAAVEDIRGKSK